MAAAPLTAMEAALADRARALPPWRKRAFDAFARTGMPNRRHEAWKWTDLRALLREPPPLAADEVIAPSVFAGAKPFEITIMNGRADHDAALPDGVVIERKNEAPLSPLAADHPMANLCAAFAEDVFAIAIRGADAQPILIRRIAGAGLVHQRAIVALAPGSKATVIESFDGAGPFFSNSVAEFCVGAGARLHRIILQNAGEEGAETALSTVALGSGAVFDQRILSFGGRAARLEVRIAHEGEGAQAVLNSAIATTGARHADVTTLVTHEAQGCETRQMHRAALKEKSRGVFQGKFYVARGAQKTDAEMHAAALLLSGLAEANHKPELEIYADDVQCAHGSTAGALDADAIFYMRQRGLDEHAARSFLIEAFLGEVFDGVAHPGIERALRDRIARWLEVA